MHNLAAVEDIDFLMIAICPNIVLHVLKVLNVGLYNVVEVFSFS